MLLSIVIPCFNSERTIRQVVELSMEEIARIERYSCEFILVNDFSRDGTWTQIQRLCQDFPNVKGLNLSRNFGQHNAIMAGLHYAQGDYIMGMDDDLQTHPSQIPAILDGMKEDVDVVFGIFRQRQFGWLKNLTSAVASFIQWHMVSRPKGIEASNFWCCRRYVRDEVIKYTNCSLYLQMLFFRTTSRISNIRIEHFARESGQSNYTFRRSWRLFMGFLNYSVIPLKFSAWLGGFFSLLGFIFALVVVIRKLVHPDIAVGWSSLMSVILILFGITFLILGILGEYVGNMMLDFGRTPQFIVRDTFNIATIDERSDR